MIIINLSKTLFLIFFIFFLPSSVLADNLLLKSLGHSSFLIKGDGKSILINPFKAIGCANDLEEPKEVKADFILASSKLLDEGYNPNNQLMFVNPGIYKYEDLVLNGISIPHDRLGGRRFGMATVWSWEQNNLKIVHMGGAAGDMNIDNEIILARPDILFISIGGGIKSYDGEEASRIVKILKPSIVIPVHFLRRNQEIANCDFSNADLFIKNLKDFKVNYVGKDFQINPSTFAKNTIFIFSD